MEELEQEYNIDEISIRMDDISRINEIEHLDTPKTKLYYKNCASPQKDFDTLKQINEKIEELTSGINETDSQMDKFTTIYRRIAENISYNYVALEAIKKEMDFEELTEDEAKILENSQNLEGILSQTTVCAGYSRILQCALNRVGIECKYITGTTNKERDLNHAWN